MGTTWRSGDGPVGDTSTGSDPSCPKRAEQKYRRERYSIIDVDVGEKMTVATSPFNSYRPKSQTHKTAYRIVHPLHSVCTVGYITYIYQYLFVYYLERNLNCTVHNIVRALLRIITANGRRPVVIRLPSPVQSTNDSRAAAVARRLRGYHLPAGRLQYWPVRAGAVGITLPPCPSKTVS
jgi:hypothetical protein